MASQQLLLFGDQTVEFYPPIQRLCRESRKSNLLQTFLRDATDTLQAEVAKLELTEQAAFKSFSSLLELAEEHSEKEDTIGLVHTVLICIARLGELILHVEDDPSILGLSDKRIHALGFCTGLLPAAAAAAARSITELVQIGTEIVSITCRLASGMVRRTRNIEEEPGNWGYTVLGLSLKELRKLLDDFHQQHGVPTHRHAYIGVEAQTWCTLFGPPSLLDKFFSFSAIISQAPKLKLRAYGAVHAPHLPILDLDTVLGSSHFLNIPVKPSYSVFSSSSCKPFKAADLRELLLHMMPDILQNALDMTGLTKAFTSSLSAGGNTTLRVMGSTTAQALVLAALKSERIPVNLVEQADTGSQPTNLRAGSDLVAIIGMSGRFPGSENISTFWENLLDGREFHKKIPSNRFDIQKYFDATTTSKNSTSVPYGCFLDSPGQFDTRLFNVSPREALQMEPIQRLLLMVSYEALETAGYADNGTISTESKRIATYFGQAADDWRDINHNQGIDMYYVPGLERGFAPGRLNYHYKWEGASYSVDSACASSASAIGLACDALLNRDCDTALAGGGNVISSPDVYAGLSRGGFLSTTGACKTFSNKADGYCRGEGVGVVVLKRLEDAIKENDNILTVIRGHARNHSANAVSITHPHAETQERLYKQVLQASGVDPNEINYVEMHGTATEAGDFTEMKSVTSVLGKGRTKKNPLIVGGVKASIGHGEASAGVAALIKSIMILQNGIVPPQPGAPFQLNPKFPPLKEMNVRVADEKILILPRPKEKKRVLLNNFDAAGGNTCFVLEEPPLRQPKSIDPRPYHVVTCSARTPASLKANKERLLRYLEAKPRTSLSDLAYTTTARKMHEVLKTAYHGQNVADIAQQLRADVDSASTGALNKRPTAEHIVFLFTGQGSQYAGMGKELFRSSPRFRESINSFDQLCLSQKLPSFKELIESGTVNVKSISTVRIQLAIVSLELALAELWRSWGVEPDLVIGHSLGEYSALCVSGVLSVSDTLYLVGRRASMMEQKCTKGSHSMLAVASSRSIVASHLDSTIPSCQVACENGPSATVVSGSTEEIEILRSKLQAIDLRCKVLSVPYGFHSTQLEPILEDFEACARGVNFAKPRVPIASTLLGSIVDDIGTFTPKYLSRQARERVQFIQALEACKSNGFHGENTLWIELGPDAVCLSMARSTIEIPSSMLVPTIKSGEDNWKTISAALASTYQAKKKLNWAEFHKPYLNSLALLQLPTYSFDQKDYWVTYQIEEPRGSTIPEPVASADVRQKQLSTCLQSINSESFEGGNISVTFVSHTSDPKLAAAISGHLIEGVALCPSGVFCDMAYTAGKYVYEKANKGKSVPAMSLCDLEITHPLVVPESGLGQTILVTATKARGDEWSLTVSFSIQESSSVRGIGQCQVRFGNSTLWQTSWSKMEYFILSRAQSVLVSAKVGDGDYLQKSVIYKLFSGLVRYSERYRGVDDVGLSNDWNEAVANVRLQDCTGAGDFTYSPYWTDQLVHIAGFMLNANPNTPEDVAYIAVGFESIQIAEELTTDKPYCTYIRMKESEKKNHIVGDIYVFSGHRIVALCSGLLFQMMSRTVLHHILGIDSHQRSHPALKTPNQISQSSKQHTSVPQPEPAVQHRVGAVGANDATDPNIIEVLLQVVAAETGIDRSEIDSSTEFADIGVDSLMSIAIIAAVNNQVGIDLGASFFNENPTVADVQRSLAAPEQGEDSLELETVTPETDSDYEQTSGSESQSTQPSTIIATPEHEKIELIGETEVQRQEEEPKQVVVLNKEYSSNVVLVQGRASSKETPLFLICDGAGSATAYIHLPPFPTRLRVYALESPFLSCPAEYTHKFEEVAEMYITAIRKTQPSGPYRLGGWSAGGAFAYEVSRLLIERGETVLGLIIMDMRVPRPMPDFLEPTAEFLEHIGLAAGINRAHKTPTAASERLKQHLLSTVKSLMVYQPTPMRPHQRPLKTVLIWAKLGLSQVMDEETHNLIEQMGLEDEPEGNVMEDAETGLGSWFYSKRDKFGPNGWDKLAGDVDCHVIEGADHFSMVTPPYVKMLGKLLQAAITESSK